MLAFVVFALCVLVFVSALLEHKILIRNRERDGSGKVEGGF